MHNLKAPFLLLLLLFTQTFASIATPSSTRLKKVLINQLSLKSLYQSKPTTQKSLKSSFKGLTTRQSVSNPSGALSGETCFTDSDCARGSCVASGPIPCIPGSFGCACLIPSCNSNSDCLTGEQCVLHENDYICISENSRFAAQDGNLTFGICETFSECATGRDCFALNIDNSFRICTVDDITCTCLPAEIDFCETHGSSDGCTDGEVCETLAEAVEICVDPTFADSFEFSAEPTVEETAMPSEESLGPLGLTMDKCSEDMDCFIGRKCECLRLFADCLCLPAQLDTCLDDEDCVVEGEVCGKLVNIGICVSESIVKSLEASGKKGIDLGDTKSFTE